MLNRMKTMFEKLTVDIYEVLSEDWFEQIGDISDTKEEYMPLNIEKVCTAFYTTFFGNERVELFVNKKEKIYYIFSTYSYRVNDYECRTSYGWLKSDSKYYSQITEIINKIKLEVEKNGWIHWPGNGY